MNIHRGGTKDEINNTQREISQILQDITDIIERE
jgi:hypothetical protein